jgi:DNA-3-methyladenine glycosylase
MSFRLPKDFYTRDVLEVAPELPGKKLVLVNSLGRSEYFITEVEAYRGGDDLACHASKGMTERTRVMFDEGGCLYMYLIYGMYWMLNIVTGVEGQAQAALIRGLEGIYGPGRLTKRLGLDKSYYGESLLDSPRIWLEEGREHVPVQTGLRIGVDYAGEWAKMPWRFFI